MKNLSVHFLYLLFDVIEIIKIAYRLTRRVFHFDIWLPMSPMQWNGLLLGGIERANLANVCWIEKWHLKGLEPRPPLNWRLAGNRLRLCCDIWINKQRQHPPHSLSSPSKCWTEIKTNKCVFSSKNSCPKSTSSTILKPIVSPKICWAIS